MNLKYWIKFKSSSSILPIFMFNNAQFLEPPDNLNLEFKYYFYSVLPGLYFLVTLPGSCDITSQFLGLILLSSLDLHFLVSRANNSQFLGQTLSGSLDIYFLVPQTYSSRFPGHILPGSLNIHLKVPWIYLLVPWTKTSSFLGLHYIYLIVP